MFKDKNRFHLIGIGGIGMSGIAQLLLAFGYKVSGSDIKASELTKKLEGLGAQVYIGHKSSNIKDTQVVIYSSAIKQGNPELLAARSLCIPLLARAKALGMLSNQKSSIAVTGAHGKTTTTSLISHLLIRHGLEPTVCVGGELLNLNGNALLGKGQYFVLEADESDGSFINLNPLYAIVTNIDREHLDYYRDLEHIKEAFTKFINNTRELGCVFFCQDDRQLGAVVRSLNKRAFSYGLSHKAQLSARDILLEAGHSYFDCIYQGEALGRITLQIPGQHNISNALAAVALGLEIKLDFQSIQEALASYIGVRRRLQLKLKANDILIFDDYAHHPTEIKASIAALKNFRPKRLWAVFQPHRYTRTKFLMGDFGRCFQGVDHLIVTDIYPASEAPITGVNAENICQKAEEANIKDVRFLPQERILAYLLEHIQPGDLIAIMGAGNIGSVADALVEEIRTTRAL